MADHAPQANAHAVAAHMHAVGNLLERVCTFQICRLAYVNMDCRIVLIGY